MKYGKNNIPDTLSVTGVFTILSPNFTKITPKKGESHDFPELVFVKNGEHSFLVDDKTLTVKSGQMLIYAPNSFHSSLKPSNAEARIISFDIETTNLSSIYNRVLTLTESQIGQFEELFNYAVKFFKYRTPINNVRGMALSDNADKFSLQRIKLKLEIFLIDILERFSSEPRKTKDIRWDKEYSAVLEFMHKNVTKSLTLEDIAKGSAMSVSKLKLLVKAKNGSGPISCFISIKIDYAKKLITLGNSTLTEIAYELGFSSIHYFSRQFKKVTGISPTEFAKQL